MADPVASIVLVGSTKTSLEFSWSLPLGLVDYFLVTCTNRNGTIPLVMSDSYILSNSSTSFKCENLTASQMYEINIKSVRFVEDVFDTAIFKTKSILALN